MKMYTAEPITIDGPVVVIPLAEYDLLLKEAGYRATPKLDKRIQDARARLRKGNGIGWAKVKHDLL